ncbi:MAG TPA: sulfate permease [Ktedonobacterales bacterium]|jgi:high affinity sulfate transporter 1|nr:sulfate permease [Ktedonobacterales bacterium]
MSAPSSSSSRRARLEQWAPGLRVLRTYDRSWLSKDLVAGLVLSALLIPQGMAYAELAGLPAITGLYTTVICLLAYAIFGPSPRLVLGPDSSLGPMIAAAILPLAAGSVDRAVGLAGTLALLVGAICVIAAVARLGFVADLISKPVRMGYLAGLAVTIAVGQLPKLLGFSVDADSFVQEVRAIVTQLGQTNFWTFAVGLLTLVIIVGLRRWAPRAPGILFAVFAAIVVTSLLNLAAHDVATVGVLPQGFPLPQLPRASLSDLPILIATAFGISLVAIGDTISTSAGFASRQGLEIDANQELVGIGAANVLAGFFQGFPISTSSSRTAVAEQSGAKTQLTGVVSAAVVLVMLLFLPGLVRNLPQSALAAILIVAAAGLLDLEGLRQLLLDSQSEFVLAIICALGVIFIGVLQGILVAILLSVFQLFARIWRPRWAVMGREDGLPGFQDLQRHPAARPLPDILIIRWSAPLMFANATVFRSVVREQLTQRDPQPKWVVIAAEPITELDTTAGDMLRDLDLELNAKGIHLAFAELQGPVREHLIKLGLQKTIDARNFYPTLDTAIEAIAEQAPTE